MTEFTTRSGKQLKGTIVRKYEAFEGGLRYIIRCDGVDYRCILKDGKYVEYYA